MTSDIPLYGSAWGLLSNLVGTAFLLGGIALFLWRRPLPFDRRLSLKLLRRLSWGAFWLMLLLSGPGTIAVLWWADPNRFYLLSRGIQPMAPPSTEMLGPTMTLATISGFLIMLQLPLWALRCRARRAQLAALRCDQCGGPIHDDPLAHRVLIKDP